MRGAERSEVEVGQRMIIEVDKSLSTSASLHGISEGMRTYSFACSYTKCNAFISKINVELYI